jgi:hypothetical protein
MAATNRPTDYELAQEARLNAARRHHAMLQALDAAPAKPHDVYTALNTIAREESLAQAHVEIALYCAVEKNRNHRYRPPDPEMRRRAQVRKGKTAKEHRNAG